MPSMLSVREERRSRSKSPGGRERERSRSNVREEKRSSRSTRRYEESESEESYEVEDRRYSSSKSSKKQYDSPSEDEKRRRRHSKYDDDRGEDKYRSSRNSKPEPRSKNRSPSESESDRRPSRRSSQRKIDSESEDDVVLGRITKSITDGEKFVSPRSSANHVVPMPPPVTAYQQSSGYGHPGHSQPPPGAFPDTTSRHMSYTGSDPRYGSRPPVSQYEVPSDVGHRPRAPSASTQYADPGHYQYAKVDSQVRYKPTDRIPPPNSDRKSRSTSEVDVITPEQLNAIMREKRQMQDRQQTRDARSSREELYIREQDDTRDVARRVSRLSMSGAPALGATLGASLAVAGHAAPMSGGKPPASPLLEAYKGTYQSISPMPSALVLANHKDDSDLSDLDLESEAESSGIDDNDPNADLRRQIWKLQQEKKKSEKTEVRAIKKREREERKAQKKKLAEEQLELEADASYTMLGGKSLKSPRGSRKSVSFYDAEDDAAEIAAALRGNKPPNVRPLINILPMLSIDDLDALKSEYKKHARIDGQGINLSKHIKARVNKHIGKAAYACSLGQWESEGFWANCYYQAGASRRELLIESLMGRTNQQIREIKNFFKDKKYDDDLERCLKTELKADKFRSAILLALEERRMPESASLDRMLVLQDVRMLHETLVSAGGESAMIQIIVLRSDTHLREVLRIYETTHGRNFAREMISKSKNLVGETLAHILNGALNRPMRDALLLHQAIAETAPGKERAELLISRLIRMHWEPKHLERVKDQYAKRYGRSLETAIKRDIQAHMKTEEGLNWTNFCINLARSCEQ